MRCIRRRCALCGNAADAKPLAATGDRMLEGLGPFLLVRVSAISVAWVHEQCARWSPEVWEDGSGDLVVSFPPVQSSTAHVSTPDGGGSY